MSFKSKYTMFVLIITCFHSMLVVLSNFLSFAVISTISQVNCFDINSVTNQYTDFTNEK